YAILPAASASTLPSPSLHDALPIYGRGRHQQTLVGTDVGCRLGTADVLFTRLQGQGVAFPAVAIQGAANDAPGHLADVFLLTAQDRKSTRLNSSHVKISYAVFCLKK